jgi:hypothetical protein
MSKYKINVTVNLIECDEEINDSPIELEDGSYQFTIDKNVGESIDGSEIAVLNTAYPAIREALAQHLEAGATQKRCKIFIKSWTQELHTYNIHSHELAIKNTRTFFNQVCSK